MLHCYLEQFWLVTQESENETKLVVVNITGPITESLDDIIHYNYGGYKSIGLLLWCSKCE